jgi:hypothetical protein
MGEELEMVGLVLIEDSKDDKSAGYVIQNMGKGTKKA